jgi:hypothetical protein
VEFEPARKYSECVSAILEPAFDDFMRKCESGGCLQPFGEEVEAAVKISPAMLDRWYDQFLPAIKGSSHEKVFTREEFGRDFAQSAREALIKATLGVAVTGNELAYPYHFITYDMDTEEKLELYWDLIPYPGLSSLSFWSKRQLIKSFDPFWAEVNSPSPRLRVIKNKAFAAFGIGIDDIGDPMALRRALHRRRRARLPGRCPAPNMPLAAEASLRLAGHVAPSTSWKPYPGLFIDDGIAAEEVPAGAATNDTGPDRTGP